LITKNMMNRFARFDVLTLVPTANGMLKYEHFENAFA
jgi:hypothetical protein